jgi:hypothetical protein
MDGRWMEMAQNRVTASSVEPSGFATAVLAS